jgi:EAL domain-containing protein (putative c-di-GMP-specific phosphodiesterase class I)
MITVAEGIETKEQLRILQDEQCDQYQGYYFSRPIPGEELFKLLPKKS